MNISFLIRPMLFVLVFGILGCSKGDLTRSSAKEMIQASAELKGLSQKISLNSAAKDKLRALDILNRNGALTPKGLKLFSKIAYGEATLAQPISIPNVEITGIVAVPMSEDMKEVQFDVSAQLPPELKRLAVRVSKGDAIFRRYDDGWRLEKASLATSGEPYPMTSQEISDEQAEISAVAAEKVKLKTDLLKVVEESQTPKKDILKLSKGEVFFNQVGIGIYDIESLVLRDTEIFVDVTPKPMDMYKFGGEKHFQFKTNSSIFGNQCTLEPPGGYKKLSIESYNWIVLSNVANFNSDRLSFAKKEKCLEFEQKFEEAYRNWRNTYDTAFNALDEM